MNIKLKACLFNLLYYGSGVAQRLCNGLPREGPLIDSRWERCKNRASGVPCLNGLAVEGTLNTTNQPTNHY